MKLLIETGDEATAFALRRQHRPKGAELLTVPPGLPRTKPRALNYGLARARGEFVVVYDAEDRPHPEQLKAAVRAFRAAGEDLACLQAPLVGEGGDGWIAGQWVVEYAVQFGRVHVHRHRHCRRRCRCSQCYYYYCYCCCQCYAGEERRRHHLHHYRPRC